MKILSSKSTRSSRISPYPGRVAGQAATTAGGIADGNSGSTGQQQQCSDKTNQEEMPLPPAAAPHGQRSASRSSPCCALRDEIVSLQNSVNRLNQTFERQNRKINRMMAGVRGAGMALSEFVGELDEGQDRRANDDVDVGYASEINTGED